MPPVCATVPAKSNETKNRWREFGEKLIKHDENLKKGDNFESKESILASKTNSGNTITRKYCSSILELYKKLKLGSSSSSNNKHGKGIESYDNLHYFIFVLYFKEV